MSYIPAGVLAMILTLIAAAVMVQGTLWQEYPAPSVVYDGVLAYHHIAHHEAQQVQHLRGLPPVVVTAWVAENQ